MEKYQAKTSETSQQLTLFPSAIFSQASEVGLSPLISPEFQKTQMFGQGHAPVSHSQSRENKKGLKMTATSGLNFSGSSKSRALQSFLGNRLQAELPCNGGIQWPLTWKVRHTPALRLVFVLMPWGDRISDNGFSGWPTILTEDARTGYPPGSKEWNRLEKLKRSQPLRNRVLAVNLKHYGILPGQRYQINPEFVRWLMGYPTGWTD